MEQTNLFTQMEQEEWERRRISDHIRSLRCCWPEWPGPEVGLNASVGECVVFSLTKGRNCYHYMAPVRLVGRDGDAFIAEIEYGDDAPGNCRGYNGERLRLEIWQVWAPVQELLQSRGASGGSTS